LYHFPSLQSDFMVCRQPVGLQGSDAHASHSSGNVYYRNHKNAKHASAWMQDRASYAAGVQAALLRALQEALPGQQALGSLSAAVARLQGQMDEERLHARRAETGLAEVAARLQVGCSPMLPLSLPADRISDNTYLIAEVGGPWQQGMWHQCPES
jgi:hypothetical protein